MKTPKEKAAELIDKFTYWNTSEAEREGIKSALHCVAEMINEFDLLEHYYRIDYWYEVKNEINNL
jgi:hypothetical protein